MSNIRNWHILLAHRPDRAAQRHLPLLHNGFAEPMMHGHPRAGLPPRSAHAHIDLRVDGCMGALHQNAL
ncbi:hypothetical protein EOS_18590 [Caballeronia mineralivorans PML1(12)]|uniref:Uncharacterized protein n=1 Tax=Caballeronia mineralivorans PML1(12) TaxID=908627 RepID=A0A0J1CW54_9BURK|nr:hypothetical protein EOS_18590 [Caballeronia mineralivorans PML1(12)]